ncbi:MAG: hypothetical protein ACFWT2_12200 [Thermoanaerobacterium thermosaccharolyticum]|jgi:hypothetical protein
MFKKYLTDESGDIFQGVIWVVAGIILATVFLKYVLPGLKQGSQAIGNSLSGS